MRSASRLFVIALILDLLLAPAGVAQQPEQTTAPAFKAEELDQLLAPIALYPDELIAQILTAATYPLETFKEFPPSQRPGSFTIDQAMEKLKQSLGD